MALRRLAAKTQRQAWTGLVVSGVLFVIALMTIRGLTSERATPAERQAFFMIAWLFMVRFLYSLWRLWTTNRDARKYRVSVERQLSLSGLSETKGPTR